MEKNVLVTSGTSGIGKAISQAVLRQLTHEDDRLLVNYGHNDEQAQAFLRTIPEERRRQVQLLKADMSTEEGLRTLVGQVLASVDSLDWLVLNTGVGTYIPFDEYTLDIWSQVMTTNVSIPAFLVHALRNNMRKGGKILFMGSYAGIIPYSSSVVYGVSKAAVHFLAKSLVKEFDAKKVTVNAVAPGFIETPWQNGRPDESRKRINQKIAAHRFGDAQEVAELCLQVLSNDYINGAVLEITGGYGYF